MEISDHYGPTRLTTLGSLELHGGDGRDPAGLLSRPKELALLVYLAASTPPVGYISRDTLLPLFWPDLDEEHARHALRQMIYSLRQYLGPGAVRCRGSSHVGTDPEQLICDVVQLRGSAVAGRWKEVLAIYRGDFLDGFNPGGVAADLEQWMDGVREQLRALAIDAARRLSEAAESAGDLRGAVRWIRRGVEIMPHSERDVRRLVRLLARTESVPVALEAYDRYRRHLESQLGISPGHAIRLEIEDLLARHGASWLNEEEPKGDGA